MHCQSWPRRAALTGTAIAARESPDSRTSWLMKSPTTPAARERCRWLRAAGRRCAETTQAGRRPRPARQPCGDVCAYVTRFLYPDALACCIEDDRVFYYTFLRRLGRDAA